MEPSKYNPPYKLTMPFRTESNTRPSVQTILGFAFSFSFHLPDFAPRQDDLKNANLLFCTFWQKWPSSSLLSSLLSSLSTSLAPSLSSTLLWNDSNYPKQKRSIFFQGCFLASPTPTMYFRFFWAETLPFTKEVMVSNRYLYNYWLCIPIKI